jgi:biopolymer transport protein ExbB
MNLIMVLIKGGWLMLPIAVCSILVIVVAVERALVLRRARIDTGQFMMHLRAIVHQGQISKAREFCEKTGGPLASVLGKGLEKHKSSAEAIRTAIEDAGRLEVHALEKRLGVLATLAGVTPLLGFLGTVTGMIRAFMQIQNLGGSVTSNVLAGGIWEALVTTAAGLTVGIIAYIIYNTLVGKVQDRIHEMEEGSVEIIELLGEAR